MTVLKIQGHLEYHETKNTMTQKYYDCNQKQDTKPPITH